MFDKSITDNRTIVAQCTPPGAGALALIRISGPHAITIATKISKLASGILLDACATHTIHYGAVVDTHQNTIDHVLFLLMHGPHTFTGHHTVEITCHNNPFIVHNIIEQACHHGAQLAKPGEFSQQAVENNKLDVTQAEAINELIHANTQMALKQSLQQLKGSLSAWIATLENELFRALAYSESSFEFIDEELQFGPQITAITQAVQNSIATLQKTYNQQQHIRQGIRIALIGTVNAGKSSLFNALINKDRAIVSSIAGTTRDSIEAGLYKNGNYWTLVDTAGLRSTEDIIEQQGIARSHEEAGLADIILLVIDGSRKLTQQEEGIYTELLMLYRTKSIVVYTKNDLPLQNIFFDVPTSIEVSTHTKQNVDVLEHFIEEKITHLFASLDAPFLLNQRQMTILNELSIRLNTILGMASEETIAYELLSYHIKEALEHLSEFTGKTISEKGMDTIFRQFCIGK